MSAPTAIKRLVAEFEQLSTEALRLGALARSAQRSAVVARRRIFWRWCLWLVLQFFRFVVLPVLVVAAGFWLYDKLADRLTSGPPEIVPDGPSRTPSLPLPTRPALPALPAQPDGTNASEPASDRPAPPGLHLRMDPDEALPRSPSIGTEPAALPQTPQAQSSGPTAIDRSTRER